MLNGLTEVEAEVRGGDVELNAKASDHIGGEHLIIGEIKEGSNAVLRSNEVTNFKRPLGAHHFCFGLSKLGTVITHYSLYKLAQG